MYISSLIPKHLKSFSIAPVRFNSYPMAPICSAPVRMGMSLSQQRKGLGHSIVLALIVSTDLVSIQARHAVDRRWAPSNNGWAPRKTVKKQQLASLVEGSEDGRGRIERQSNSIRSFFTATWNISTRRCLFHEECSH